MFILFIVGFTIEVSAQQIVIGWKKSGPYSFDQSMRSPTVLKLTNPSNFGPAGVVPITFKFVELTGSITESKLTSNNIDILDLSINNYDAGAGGSGLTATTYTAAELAAIKNWTASVNHVVLAFQGYAAALGGTSYVLKADAIKDNPNNLTTLGQSIFNGKFGNYQPFQQSGTFRGLYSGRPDESSCVVIEDSSSPNNTTGLVNNLTGDIYFADVDIMGTQSGLTTDNRITSSTDILVANLFYGMAQLAINKPIDPCQFFRCPAGISGPSLNATAISIKCPATTTNLNSLLVGALPVGTTLKWFTTPDRVAGTEVATPTSVPVGTYYAFYYAYSTADDCYSPYTKVVAEQGITISTSELSEFSYVFGYGPSAMQALIVSGACLSKDITIKPQNTNFEISRDGINWSKAIPITLSLTTPSPNGIVENTNIYVRLREGLAVGTYTGNLTLTSNGATTKIVALIGYVLDYCTPNDNNIVGVTNVIFGSINSNSTKSTYTTSSTDVNLGTSYTLSVTLDTQTGSWRGYPVYTTTYCKAWIDWNHDGDFDDLEEGYYLGYRTSNGILSDNITVPMTAMVGITKMRIICSTDPDQLYPCPGSTIKGEVEDYTVNILKNYWKGSTSSSDWGTNSNWTAGVVPTDGADVEYLNNGSSNVAVNDLELDKDRTIGNLINATSKKLIIPAGLCLKVNGSIQTNGVASKILIKSRTATTTSANGSLIFPNAYKVFATVEMYSMALKFSEPRVMSDGSKYSYSWQFFGIPLKQVQADPTFAGSYVRRYSESKTGRFNKWTQLGNADVINSFEGCEITQDAPKTISFSGELENGSKTIPLCYTTTANVFDCGQHILSNPYAAAIDVRKLIFGDNTEKTIFLYNTGSFYDWSINYGGTTSDDANPQAGMYLSIPQRMAGVTSEFINDIPSMSSFLVKATDTSGKKSGSVTINYSSVICKNVNPMRAKATNPTNSSRLPIVKIDLIGQNYSDKMWIVTESECTKNFDNGWDGRKMLGSVLSPQIYAAEADGDYQINVVDDMDNTDIAFQPGNELEYTMKFTNENIKDKYDAVYLVDFQANKTVDVTETGSEYTFMATSTGKAMNRFRIMTRKLEDAVSLNKSTMEIYSSQRDVCLKNLNLKSGECVLCDVLGRVICSKSFGPNSLIKIGSNLSVGVYIAAVIIDGKKTSSQVIVQ